MTSPASCPACGEDLLLDSGGRTCAACGEPVDAGPAPASAPSALEAPWLPATGALCLLGALALGALTARAAAHLWSQRSIVIPTLGSDVAPVLALGLGCAALAAIGAALLVRWRGAAAVAVSGGSVLAGAGLLWLTLFAPHETRGVVGTVLAVGLLAVLRTIVLRSARPSRLVARAGDDDEDDEPERAERASERPETPEAPRAGDGAPASADASP